MKKITREKHGHFINREGGIVKTETKDITDNMRVDEELTLVRNLKESNPEIRA